MFLVDYDRKMICCFHIRIENRSTQIGTSREFAAAVDDRSSILRHMYKVCFSSNILPTHRGHFR